MSSVESYNVSDASDATATETVFSAAKLSHITAYPPTADLENEGALATFITKTQLSLVFFTVAEIGLNTANDKAYWRRTSCRLGQISPRSKSNFNSKSASRALLMTKKATRGRW